MAADKTMTAAEATALRNVACMLEHRYLISKYRFVNGQPKTVTYGRKKNLGLGDRQTWQKSADSVSASEFVTTLDVFQPH